MQNLFETLSHMQSWGIALTRLGIIIVLLWIGGLKIVPYEAEGIVPFVANSPFMSFLMDQPQDYRAHMNPEGKLIPENKAWHAEHGTYTASYVIGAIIVSLGRIPWHSLPRRRPQPSGACWSSAWRWSRSPSSSPRRKAGFQRSGTLSTASRT